MAKKQSKASRYGVHPGVKMVQDWISQLQEKTGRTLEEWMKFIQKEGPATEEERRDWLKTDLKLGTNTAWWLAERSVGKGSEEDTDEGYLKVAEVYVQEQYQGKENLIPLYEALLELSLGMAKDVKACPCKTMVPIYRQNVIAQIKPTTKTRIDFGLALGDTKAKGRLIDTGGFAKKDRITHRIEIKMLEDVDEVVSGWLKKAYERNG